MSVAETDRAASRAAKRGPYDLVGLGKSLRLVAGMALPIAAVTSVLWGLAYAAYRQDLNATDLSGNLDAELIREQVRRATTSAPADLAFVGDSSCLFGIDAPTLRERFPGTSIENFCTMAWVGPAGYGVQITQMLERGTLPRNLVIYLHPDQFTRHPGWDAYVDIVKRGTQAVPGPVDPSPTAALDHARKAWVGRVLYRPIPGPNSLYYGSFENMMRSMREHHGSLVNAGGLRSGTVEQLAKLYRAWKPGPGVPYRFATNAAYDESLTELARVLAALDRSRVFLLVAPFSLGLAPEALAERSERVRWIAAKLNLPAGNVISSPAVLPLFLFVDNAHANRSGRILLTRIIADYLPP